MYLFPNDPYVCVENDTPQYYEDGLRSLAILSASAPSHGMGRNGWRHDQQNTKPHITSNRGCRRLSIANNAEAFPKAIERCSEAGLKICTRFLTTIFGPLTGQSNLYQKPLASQQTVGGKQEYPRI